MAVKTDIEVHIDLLMDQQKIFLSLENILKHKLDEVSEHLHKFQQGRLTHSCSLYCHQMYRVGRKWMDKFVHRA